MDLRTELSIGTGLVLIFYYLMAKKHRLGRPPPGPKPLPLIGNVLDMPQKRAWVTFMKWKKQYGDVVYVNVLGQPVVVLNSRKACEDLLEKRSKKYSDRPRFVMINELMGWDYGLPFMPYSNRWRLHRRLFHQYFNEARSRNYIGVQQQRAHAFLRNLMKQPELFRDHIRLLFAETIMDVVYGYEVKGHEDKFLTTIAAAMRGFSTAAQTGKFYVEMFPFLKAIPSWVPGAGFKTQAEYWRKCILASRDDPAAYVKEHVEIGDDKPCILSSMLSRVDDSESLVIDAGETEEEAAKGVSATAYAGGSDTSVSALEAFFLAIANHPECQEAARAELDAVLGGSRLPKYEDKKDLPYISAIVNETLRWHVITPGSIAHALTEDDEYEGYLLPKGSIVIPNIWAILHDPEIYPDPDTFNPSRWLIDTPEGKKINHSLPRPEPAFGYGRRICPGRYFAENFLFVVIATVLASFTIHPLDSNGAPIEKCEEGVTDEVLVWPIAYNVAIKPRSAEARWLVNETGLTY